MKKFLESLRVFIKSLSPQYWIQIRPFDKDWDTELRVAMNTYPCTYFNTYSFYLGGVKVWRGLGDAWFCSYYDPQKRCRRRTSVLMNEKIARECPKESKPIKPFVPTTVYTARINAALTNAQNAAASQQLANQNGLGGGYAGSISLSQAQITAMAANLQAIDENKLATFAELKETTPEFFVKKSPDYIQALEGWRGWSVNGNRLSPLGADYNASYWVPKQAVPAACGMNGGHICPDISCTCGYWAFKNLQDLVKVIRSYAQVTVVGPVYQWGKVIDCEQGYRSEFAYPKELWLLQPGLEYLGQLYGVPIRRVKKL